MMNNQSTPGRHTGTLFVVSAPSGAGKTSLIKALLENESGITVSVSHTTRTMRPGEQDGVHYHFVDHEAFSALQQQGEFLESAQVFDNFYGTSQSAVAQLLDKGLDVILEIDWQGARQVRKVFAEAVSIFVLPPSRQELETRLKNRAQDSEAVIARRMRDAVQEMVHYPEYDYLIVNDQFEQALQELGDVIRAQKFRLQSQQHRLHSLLSDLTKDR